MRTANYTDFRANLKDYMDTVIDDCETVIINRGNNKGVVMISLEEYNSLKETEYIMSSPEMMEVIRKGDEDIKNGNGSKIEIEDLWKEFCCRKLNRTVIIGKNRETRLLWKEFQPY